MKARGERRKTLGFTLIEMMAVVVIIGLIFTFGVPNLSAYRDNLLEDEALKVANLLEIARQRAVMTGRRHRLWIDLQEGVFSVEWFVTDEEADVDYSGVDPNDVDFVDPAAAPAAPGSPGSSGGKPPPVEMRPPKRPLRDWQPLVGRWGEGNHLGVDYYFVGLDGVDGWIESGSVPIEFDSYGTAQYAELQIADGWDNQLSIIVEPAVERPRIERPGDS